LYKNEFKNLQHWEVVKTKKQFAGLLSFFSQPILLKQIITREKQKMRTGHGEQVLFFSCVFLGGKRRTSFGP